MHLAQHAPGTVIIESLGAHHIMYPKTIVILSCSIICSALICFCLYKIISSVTDSTENRSDFDASGTKWGYANVREGVHLFWWLYYTTANVTKPTDRPLVIWLEGGPGQSSTGEGNFDGIGPLDIDLETREYTWVKDVNVLFIDSPVGAGFSYLTNKKFHSNSTYQMSTDLVELIRIFMTVNPEFQKVPLHIFGGSYSGKVAVQLADLLNDEIEKQEIECNLKSVTSLSGWISPIDSIKSWAPYLFELGFVDQNGRRAIEDSVALVVEAAEDGDFLEAVGLLAGTIRILKEKTYKVSMWNVLEYKEIPKEDEVEEIIENEGRHGRNE